MTAADDRQARAADPAASTWLHANAGSGKTKVLIDRVARLLLSGCDPSGILCLTYTKAAAAEMQNRLFRRLGEWAMMPEPALRAAIAAVGHAGPLPPETLARARQLFARAIEVPGGLRIQTIHAFCAGLLRRFPLEAGVSPAFTELDDRTTVLLRREVADDLALRLPDGVVRDLAALIGGRDPDGFLATLAGLRHDFGAMPARDDCLQRMGLPAGTTLQDLAAVAFDGTEAALFAVAIPALRAGPASMQAIADLLSQIDPAAPTPDDLAALEAAFLTADGQVRKKVPTATVRLGDQADAFRAFMDRVATARDRRLALAAAADMATLARFAVPFLDGLARAKAARAVLDFDDLIDRARRLLADPCVSAWVLYKLDGGLSHVLVDEAQDTSPVQWQVVRALIDETLASGQRDDVPRSLFVVGDRKQSIYSFQGADVAAFDGVRAEVAGQLMAPGPGLQQLELERSFRSSPAILRVVDAVFAGPRGADVGGAVRHVAAFPDMPGRVDLWPAVPKAPPADLPGWADPSDVTAPPSEDRLLATRVADFIAGQLAAGTVIPTRDGTRPMRAGDVLVLVQRRTGIFPHIISACKARGLPIAGADRLRIGAELAVKDILAVLSFIATDADDLSLAAALRSPLFGWDEDRLFRLAHPRPGLLWAALRADPQAGEALAVLTDLRDRADFLRPHDLIQRLLIRHDGRRRLIARLGDEAADGIDALVDLALDYEAQEVPGLTGFLTWLAAQEVQVKRPPDSSGGLIRVMTVHGAKGLEAPVVILPETEVVRPRAHGGPMALPGGGVAWLRGSAATPACLRPAIDDSRAAQAAERGRLLYVAMTRAESWLVAAAAGDTAGDCWHADIAAGLQAAGAEVLADGTLRHAHGIWPEAVPDTSAVAAALPDLPAWVATAAPAAPRPPRPVAPSGLPGPKALPSEAGADPALALPYGSAVHRMLEWLPRLPEADREAAALAAAAGLPDPLAAIAEARAILQNQSLAHLFAPGTLAEVPLSATVAGLPMAGTADRLILGPGVVTCIDFKTNRAVPDRAEDVPAGVLAQLGAYEAMLAQIFPGHAVEVAVLWTATARLMPVPPAILRAALLAATTA
jgi:ATP-dependent helicase/nuclease subunit A